MPRPPPPPRALLPPPPPPLFGQSRAKCPSSLHLHPQQLTPTQIQKMQRGYACSICKNGKNLHVIYMHLCESEQTVCDASYSLLQDTCISYTTIGNPVQILLTLCDTCTNSNKHTMAVHKLGQCILSFWYSSTQLYLPTHICF